MIISDGGCVPICVVFISKTSPWKDCRFTSEWPFIAMRYASRHSPKHGFIHVFLGREGGGGGAKGVLSRFVRVARF